MPAFHAQAPGKIILFGEHAVVYGRPAIAVPVRQVQAEASIWANPRGESGAFRLQAPAIGLDAWLDELPPRQPLAAAVRQACAALGIEKLPAGTLRVTSSIPVAAGLGSGAAVSVAVLRVISAYLGHPFPDGQVSALAYEIEKLHHGTPSGIDNSVITYNMPVYFVRGRPVETFRVPSPFKIVIGDTGVASPTAVAVGDLRQAWQASPDTYEPRFDAIARVVGEARNRIEAGQIDVLGPLMDQNHALLQTCGVSSPELDRLVIAARQAGALGAKLSGGGRGGNMIALVEPPTAERVASALRATGAIRTIITAVSTENA